VARFRTILCDPPWEYVYWSPGQGKRATDPLRDLAALPQPEWEPRALVGGEALVTQESLSL
jgi:hypothetical protein